MSGDDGEGPWTPGSPIRDLDEPLDDSDADETVARLQANKARSRHDKMVDAAQWLLTEGDCRIGWAHVDMGKDVVRHWKSDAETDPALVGAKLAGARNSLVIPKGRMFIVDCDDAKVFNAVYLMLGWESTYIVRTPTPGHHHIYLLAPEGFDITTLPESFADGDVGGEVRKGDKGMVLGPWSMTTAGVYEPVWVSPLAVAEPFLLDWLIAHDVKKPSPPGAGGSGRLVEGPWQWDGSMGSRHNHLLGLIRAWRGEEPDAKALVAKAWRYIERHGIPLTRPDPDKDIDEAELLEMAVGAVDKFDDDRPVAPVEPAVRAVTGSLFVPTETFIREVRATPAPPAVVEGMWAYNGLNFVGGGPKSGKSLFVLYAGYAIAAGQPVLGRAVARMPFVYMTEEGTPRGTADRLDRLGLTYGTKDTFTVHRSRRVLDDAYADDIIAEVRQHFGSDPVLLAIDPFRNYLPGGVSENEQGAVQPVLTRLNRLKAELPNLTLVVVHHARKSQRGAAAAGMDGEELSGSGAIYAAADTTTVWRSGKKFHDAEDDGTLIDVGMMTGKATVESKDGVSWRFGWTYDDASGGFVNGEAKPVGDGLTDDQRAIVAGLAALNEVGGVSASWTASAIAAQVGKDTENVRTVLKRLVKQDGSPVVVDGSQFALDKWRGVANRSQTVSGRMEALFDPDN